MSEIHSQSMDPMDRVEATLDLIAKSQKETDIQIKATATQMNATDARLDELGERLRELSSMYGGVSEHLGDEAELDFLAALGKRPILNEIVFDTVQPYVDRKRGSRKVEIDLLLLNDESLAVVEVKRHLQSKHIKQLHDETIPKFIEFFPEYRDRQLYAVLATYSIPKKARTHVDRLIEMYGYGLITPDRAGTDIEVDTRHMRVANPYLDPCIQRCP